MDETQTNTIPVGTARTGRHEFSAAMSSSVLIIRHGQSSICEGGEQHNSPSKGKKDGRIGWCASNVIPKQVGF